MAQRKAQAVSALLGLAISASLGCAAMMFGSSQDVKFSSTPSGASLEIDEKHVGATPAILKLKRRKDHTAVVRMEGYEDQAVTVDSRFSGEAVAWSFVGAIWWWGPFEWILDLPLGSLKELERTRVSVRLEKTEEQKRIEAVAERRQDEASRANAMRADLEAMCKERGWSDLTCQLRRGQTDPTTSAPSYYYPARQQ